MADPNPPDQAPRMQDERRLIPWWPDAGRSLGGLGRTSMYHLIRSGELPSVTIGRRRFVAVQDIEDYVERRRSAARGQGGESA